MEELGRYGTARLSRKKEHGWFTEARNGGVSGIVRKE